MLSRPTAKCWQSLYSFRGRPLRGAGRLRKDDSQLNCERTANELRMGTPFAGARVNTRRNPERCQSVGYAANMPTRRHPWLR